MRTEVKLTAEQREKILKENRFSHDGTMVFEVASSINIAKIETIRNAQSNANGVIFMGKSRNCRFASVT
jgi:hypothetical protein